MEMMDTLEICRETRADAGLLCGRVDRDEDEICLEDGLLDVGGEEEVAAAGLADDVLEAGLVDGQIEVGRVPGIDARLVEVDDGDLNLRALERDDRAGGAAWAGLGRVCGGQGSGRVPT